MALLSQKGHAFWIRRQLRQAAQIKRKQCEESKKELAAKLYTDDKVHYVHVENEVIEIKIVIVQ